jgi:hypothetical protein
VLNEILPTPTIGTATWDVNKPIITHLLLFDDRVARGGSKRVGDINYLSAMLSVRVICVRDCVEGLSVVDNYVER